MKSISCMYVAVSSLVINLEIEKDTKILFTGKCNNRLLANKKVFEPRQYQAIMILHKVECFVFDI